MLHRGVKLEFLFGLKRNIRSNNYSAVKNIQKLWWGLKTIFQYANELKIKKGFTVLRGFLDQCIWLSVSSCMTVIASVTFPNTTTINLSIILEVEWHLIPTRGRMTSFKAKHHLPFSLFFKLYYQKCSLVGLKFPNLKLDFYKN